MNNCPAECPNAPKYFDAYRTKFCDGCPHKLERDNLKTATEDLIFHFLGKLDAKFGFESVLKSLYQIISLKDLSRSEMTVKTAETLNVYYSEKNRAEAIREADKAG